MNERIKQLAEQASKETFPVGSMAWMEMFAELILMDVMTICEDLGDKGQDGHYCVDKIRRVFGV